ncbi:MAG: hypothetical protein R3251_02790 [Candidatus Spechtbacterales bacterium]|nr:hypothetical protein [Candidatus Spechtbacterales bacterium]
MKNYYLSTALLGLFIAIMVVIVPFNVQADHCDEGGIVCNPFESENFDQILTRITRILAVTALPVYGIMIGIAVYNLITGSVDPSRRKKAKKIFLYSTLGLFMLLLASGIIAIVGGIFG